MLNAALLEGMELLCDASGALGFLEHFIRKSALPTQSLELLGLTSDL